MESVDMVVRIPYDKTVAMFILDENNKDIDMIVEVPYNTNIKYEYDKNTNHLISSLAYLLKPKQHKQMEN